MTLDEIKQQIEQTIDDSGTRTNLIEILDDVWDVVPDEHKPECFYCALDDTAELRFGVLQVEVFPVNVIVEIVNEDRTTETIETHPAHAAQIVRDHFLQLRMADEPGREDDVDKLIEYIDLAKPNEFPEPVIKSPPDYKQSVVKDSLTTEPPLLHAGQGRTPPNVNQVWAWMTFLGGIIIGVVVTACIMWPKGGG